MSTIRTSNLVVFSYSAVDFLRFSPDDNLLFTVGNKLIRFNAEDNSETVLKTFKSKLTGIHVEDSLLILSGTIK